MFTYKSISNRDQIRKIVEASLTKQTEISTQQIIDSGAIPSLKGYIVSPGKVSDSIFGGRFTIEINGQQTQVENPPLQSKQGIPLRIMIRTQRISTHDIVRGNIPFKDQVLSLNHNFMRKLLTRALGSSQIDIGLEDNCNVVVAENLKQIPLENVLRAYMAKTSTTTSLYQHYMQGEREYCGHVLPEGLIANGALPYIMDTPTTKSHSHDQPFSAQALVKQGVCTQAQYTQICNSSIFAFGIAAEYLYRLGIIAVDTKTEHGINKQGKIVSQDEIWTLDSSRFWLLEDYQQQLKQFKSGKIEALNPKSFSKEFAREYPLEKREYSDAETIEISIRYIETIEHLLQKQFIPALNPWDEQVICALKKIATVLL